MTDSFYKNPTLAGNAETPQTISNGELPKKIGKYKIESLLNRGGMSLLYLGINPETHEPLAIKVLSSKYVSHPEMVERFMKEAELIEITNHPNIVKLYGHGTWAKGVYIAMEFIQGISLRQMILQEAMSLKRALEVTLQIAHALTHLHSHGIIHRDLKPENILLTAQGGVKVIDFGISQLFTEKSEISKRVIGTPVYMSPEQKIDPMHVTFAADIYALGIVAYELILGKLSYGIIHLSIIPRGLQKILAKALQPKPEDRYEDIVDFIQALSVYLSSDELKKDMRGSDYLGEMNEHLKEAQFFLIPKELPKWPRLEIAFASNVNQVLSSVYYDFIQQRNGVCSIIIGESFQSGVEGLLQASMLKGMVRALSGNIEVPADFVSALNARMVEADLELKFSFSLLTLYPNLERFSYISCGYTPLWYLPVGSEMPRRLISNNTTLGDHLLTDVIEIDSNFSVGDTVILHTFQAGHAKNIDSIESDEAQFLDSLMENLFLPPQKQVEAIFRKVTQSQKRAFLERPIAVVGIERIA